MKNGSSGDIPPFIYNTICSAFESHMKINQYNGRVCENVRKILAGKVNQLIGKEGKVTHEFLNRLLRYTAIDVLATKCNSNEERRIRWTTYNNLKSGFENWENDLLELGFARMGENGEVEIPKNQINLGNICSSPAM